MRRTLSIYAAAILAAGLSGPAALAQGGAKQQAEEPRKETEAERRARELREAQARLKAAEEMFLRRQLEQQVNQIARWDADTNEVRLKDAGGLQGLEVPLELLLERVVEPAPSGRRLQIKEGTEVRPFAIAIQRYMASGGMKDIEGLQKFQAGEGENPFAEGVPNRAYQAVGDLLAALNQQDEDELTEGEREAEARRLESRKALQAQVVEQLGLDPEDTELRARIMRELLLRAERDGRAGPGVFGSFQQFAESKRAERLLDRAVRSDGFQDAMRSAADGLDRLVESDAGAALVDRMETFLESERGRELQDRVERFLESEQGERLRRRWSWLRERLEREPGAAPAPRAERARPQTPRRERAPEGGERERAPRPEPRAEPSPF